MIIDVSKKDIIWSYLAQFFSLAAGVFILPAVLKLLTPEEVGMNYLLLTINSMIILFDFGFSPQFSRNITYVFSGAQNIKKEGIDISPNDEINYKLLSNVISTAKFVYKRLAVFALVIMVTIGTLYIYHATDGFVSVKNGGVIWIIFSISTFFNLYYSYYNVLLIGKGLITISKKATVYSKLVYLILAFSLLYLDFGLIGLCIANFAAPFVNRFIAYYHFFTPDIKEKISKYDISESEKKEVFKIIWSNAKKLGLVYFGSFAISRFGIFFAGAFLTLQDVASYGIMTQLGGVIIVLSSTFFNANMPRFASLRVKNERESLIKLLGISIDIYYILAIIGCLVLICVVPISLTYIQSNTYLPSTEIIILYSIFLFLEGNHSIFSTFITTDNRIPFVKPALIVGAIMTIFNYIVLAYTPLAILGLVLVQGIVQLAYSNWKWPQYVCRSLHINIIQLIKIGISELHIKIKRAI